MINFFLFFCIIVHFVINTYILFIIKLYVVLIHICKNLFQHINLLIFFVNKIIIFIIFLLALLLNKFSSL